MVVSMAAGGLIPAYAFAAESILNVSYDPTREFYKQYDAAFAQYWKGKTGESVTIKQSHGGSGAQARAVIEGLDADVVTLALSADIDQIAEKTGKIPANWQSLLPDNSTPYSSTIVFLVRKGNPKGIHDWDDLVRDGVQVITPNPKTSGGARWNVLAAWAWAKKHYNGDDGKIRDYITKLFQHVPVLDTGARGATLSFTQRGLGDVLIAWENEAWLSLDELGPGQFEIVTPSVSIKAEPPVALVKANAEAHGTTKVAEAYLDYLYSPEGQQLAAKNYYRPSDPAKVDPELLQRFAKVDMATIADFGGWKKAQPEFFGNGGLFDQLYKPAQ
ncbi:sulfate ABC transporter substrate-binding protein [Allorhizobium sonneratiae]|uniref:sulfate ABC transporter substrate-binding protein n=1 Tax=Allorhizobium sonneratiae TaxID=2934936 RepID=UPI00237D29B2|nr:sulfate ABC transporter substrate-binding protein [Allorhizobium sonneratiae]